MYMESRKMVLMNLFAGQQCRCRPREKTWEEGEGGMTGERFCNNLRGVGKGGGRFNREGTIGTPMANSH